MFLYRNKKEYIEKLVKSEKFEFIVLYWRRRIWKTTLVKNIVWENNWFYYLWLNTNYKEQLNLLKEKFSIFLWDKILIQIDFNIFL
jgi:AAA+ ATPase superfamily predicted ATPase